MPPDPRIPRGALTVTLIATLCAGSGVAIGLRMGRAAAPPATARNGDPAGPREVQVAALSALATAAAQNRGTAAAPEAPAAVTTSGDERETITAAEERDRFVAKIRDSGPDVHGLLSRAQPMGEAWLKRLRASGVEAHMGDWECHTAGCFVAFDHPDVDAVETATAEITRSPEFNDWDAEKIRSGPVDASGRTEVTWIVFSPEAPGRNQQSVN